jgi:outer membrane biosynthesis protein TonB
VKQAGRVRRELKAASGGWGYAFAGTLVLHGAVLAALAGAPEYGRQLSPPVYRVSLVAAPRPEPQARRAPSVVERPAERPAPAAPKPAPRRTTVAPAAPPPAKPDVQREPAPRTTPAAEPLPDVTPSTGADPATVQIEGQEFPYPEYLRNLVAQVFRRWQRPTARAVLQAEVFFLIHRDGSISNLRFIKRSGNFAFDVEAQGAIEAAGAAGSFGSLPEGFANDVLPVSFFFDPAKIR